MRLTEQLGWMVRRVSVMSLPEVAYRIRRAAARGFRALRGGRSAFRIRGGTGAFRFLQGVAPRLFVPPMERPPAEARAVLDGQVPLYGRWIPWRDDPAFWHSDHILGATWPLERTSLIQYRPGNPTGDVRIVWELNRLQHLLLLATIVADDSEARPRAAALFDAQFRSWLAANPPGVGVNHASAMEASLRILSVTHAFDLARAHLSPPLGLLVAEMVVGHATDIEGRLSLYSSAGNHTIAEAVGLLYAGLLFEEHPRAAAWERDALDLLRTEGTRQVNPDGGGLEQATWYLLFVADLLGLAQALLAHVARPHVPELDDAVARARAFLQVVGRSPADLPLIGDGDGGHALSPHLRINWTRSAYRPTERSFADSGLTVVSPAEGERLVFLHNRLGMPPSCGHGHADCLSVLFRHRGVDLLIDPGTYLYGGPAALRHYFRSTAAHNTLQVGDRDQAEQAAPFMWRGSYRCQVVQVNLGPGGHSILAWHDAYRSLGVRHWRGVAYQPGRFLAIWDHIDAGRDPGVAVHWHLGCPARLHPAGREVLLAPPGLMPILMTLPEGPAVLVEGSEEPLLGWRAPSYARLESCPTVLSRPSNAARPEAVTTLWLAEGPRPQQELDEMLEQFRSAIAGVGVQGTVSVPRT